MPISNYNSTPALNTAVSGINIGEGCNASNINDAIRQIMADLATWYGTNPASLTVTGGASAGPTFINSGFIGSLANNVAQTVLTLVTGQSVTIQAFLSADSTKNVRADAFYDGTTLTITNKIGASVDIIASGANLQVKNTSGSSTAISWAVK